MVAKCTAIGQVRRFWVFEFFIFIHVFWKQVFVQKSSLQKILQKCMKDWMLKN